MPNAPCTRWNRKPQRKNYERQQHEKIRGGDSQKIPRRYLIWQQNYIAENQSHFQADLLSRRMDLCIACLNAQTHDRSSTRGRNAAAEAGSLPASRRRNARAPTPRTTRMKEEASMAIAPPFKP